MIKVVVATSFLLIGFLAKAQEFQGKAEYFVKYKEINIPQDEPKNQQDVAFNKLSVDAFKKASELTFTLDFNKFESIYKQNKKLEMPQGKSNTESISVTVDLYDCGDIYKNAKDKIIITENQISDKDFLINDKLNDFNWKLINETKKIGDYTCYKAECIIPVSNEMKAAYQAVLKEQAEKKTNLFTPEEPKESIITAWYTPEIPINQGPEIYWGLPGLILEFQDESKTILCTKIVINPKKKMR